MLLPTDCLHTQHIPVAAHIHFPVNIHTEKFPSGDAAEVFLCIQQDVNGLGSTLK